MGEFVVIDEPKRAITGAEVQPQEVDFGVLTPTAHHGPLVFVEFNRLANLWVMTPADARTAAAALEALALKAEGRKPS